MITTLCIGILLGGWIGWSVAKLHSRYNSARRRTFVQRRNIESFWTELNSQPEPRIIKRAKRFNLGN